MSFKHSAITRNTKEARDWLESIGYKPHPDSLITKGDFLYASARGYYSDRFLGYAEEIGRSYYCKDNLPLFKSITAIRGDKIESEQWYVLDKRKVVGEKIYEKGTFIKNPLEEFISYVGHKATVEELVEYFKK